MTNQIHTYRASPEDVQGLRQLCLRWNFWSFDDVLKTMENRHSHLIYTDEWRAALLYQSILEFSELIYIWVSPEARGQGLARVLFESAFGQPPRANLSLEVRVDNLAAIAFYEKMGLVCQRRIPKYYEHQWDAFVYGTSLSK